MSLPNVTSALQEAIMWLTTPQDKLAFISGANLGIRLSRVLVNQELHGEWNGDLHALASRTYMGEMRNAGMAMEDFQDGLMAGSYNTISLPDEAFIHPDLMTGPIGMRYGFGIRQTIDLVYVKGMDHFINGIAYNREDGETAFYEWIEKVEQEVANMRLHYEETTE